MAARATYSFMRSSDGGLDEEALLVFTAMNGNLHYPGSTALVAALQNAKDTYNQALSVAKNGSKAQKAEKNVAKRALKVAMRELCDYVNFTTPGDFAKLSTTGFRISNTIISPVEMQPLKKFTLTNGVNPGTVIAKTSWGRGTVMVLIEYGVGALIGDVTTWIPCPDASQTCVISGLTSGSRVWARATSVGRRGQKIIATAISTIVL
jgi:hypothetical protein